jgi:hypothetical protein
VLHQRSGRSSAPDEIFLVGSASFASCIGARRAGMPERESRITPQYRRIVPRTFRIRTQLHRVVTQVPRIATRLRRIGMRLHRIAMCPDLGALCAQRLLPAHTKSYPQARACTSLRLHRIPMRLFRIAMFASLIARVHRRHPPRHIRTPTLAQRIEHALRSSRAAARAQRATALSNLPVFRVILSAAFTFHYALRQQREFPVKRALHVEGCSKIFN